MRKIIIEVNEDGEFGVGVVVEHNDEIVFDSLHWVNDHLVIGLFSFVRKYIITECGIFLETSRHYLEVRKIEVFEMEVEEKMKESGAAERAPAAAIENSGQGLMKYVRDYIPFEHVLLNGGDDGQAFLCFHCEQEQLQQYEKELLRLAKEVEGYENAYFCPDPESHIKDIKREIREEWGSITVLNLFR